MHSSSFLLLIFSCFPHQLPSHHNTVCQRKLCLYEVYHLSLYTWYIATLLFASPPFLLHPFSCFYCLGDEYFVTKLLCICFQIASLFRWFLKQHITFVKTIRDPFHLSGVYRKPLCKINKRCFTFQCLMLNENSKFSGPVFIVHTHLYHKKHWSTER